MSISLHDFAKVVFVAKVLQNYKSVAKLQRYRKITKVLQNYKSVAKLQKCCKIIKVLQNYKSFAKLQRFRKITKVLQNYKSVAKLQKCSKLQKCCKITITILIVHLYFTQSKNFRRSWDYDIDISSFHAGWAGYVLCLSTFQWIQSATFWILGAIGSKRVADLYLKFGQSFRAAISTVCYCQMRNRKLGKRKEKIIVKWFKLPVCRDKLIQRKPSHFKDSLPICKVVYVIHGSLIS